MTRAKTSTTPMRRFRTAGGPGRRPLKGCAETPPRQQPFEGESTPGNSCGPGLASRSAADREGFLLAPADSVRAQALAHYRGGQLGSAGHRELGEDVQQVGFTVDRATPISIAISALERPSATWWAAITSVAVRLSHPPVGRVRPLIRRSASGEPTVVEGGPLLVSASTGSGEPSVVEGGPLLVSASTASGAPSVSCEQLAATSATSASAPASVRRVRAADESKSGESMGRLCRGRVPRASTTWWRDRSARP